MASMEDVLAEARATCERALVNVSFPVPTQTTTLGKLKTVSQNLAHVLRGHPYVEVHTLRSSLENRRRDPLVILPEPGTSLDCGVVIKRHAGLITLPDIVNNPEILVRILKEKSY